MAEGQTEIVSESREGVTPLHDRVGGPVLTGSENEPERLGKSTTSDGLPSFGVYPNTFGDETFWKL